MISTRTNHQAIETDRLDHHWANRLESLLSLGQSAGADLIEIFLESTDFISVLAEQDSITSVSPAFGKGAGIRVFSGLRDGFVSTNNLTERGMLDALDQALNMLGLNMNTISNSSFPGLKSLIDYSKGKNSWLEECSEVNEISEKLLTGTSSLSRNGTHLQVRRASYSRSWQEVLVAASDGTFCRDIRLHQSTGLNVLAADSDHRTSIGRRYGSSGVPNDLRDWDSEGSSQEVCKSASKMLYADYVHAGQMPAVLANKFGGVIFHEACGHLLETTQIERGTTPFSDSIGEHIANPAVTAIDEGITSGSFGSISMDDEGMEPQKTILISYGAMEYYITQKIHTRHLK